MEKIIDKDFSGAIFIKQDKDIVFQKAFGYANLPDCIPNELNTKFAIASGGKVFVAVAILKLIEEGKLTFNLSEMSERLKDFDNIILTFLLSVSQTVN